MGFIGLREGIAAPNWSYIVETINYLPFDQKVRTLLGKDLPLREAARELNMEEK
jgi:hypothetical protein